MVVLLERATNIVASTRVAKIVDGSDKGFGQGEYGGDDILVGSRLARNSGVRAGDELTLIGEGVQPIDVIEPDRSDGPIRFLWGVHAERFSKDVRERFTGATFRVSSSMDRMGVRLVDEGRVFAGASILSLVSEPVRLVWSDLIELLQVFFNRVRSLFV